MGQRKARTNNGDHASALMDRFRAMRKLAGKKQVVADLWGCPVLTVYSLEAQVDRALHAIARHADRLGVVVTYNVSLPREDKRGKPLETPVE